MHTTKSQYLEFHKRVCDEARAISEKKGSDYSDNERSVDADTFANFRGASQLGLTAEQGVLVRLQDKLSRLGTASAKVVRGDVMKVDENIEETALDALNYIIIFLALNEERKAGLTRPVPNSEEVSIHVG